MRVHYGLGCGVRSSVWGFSSRTPMEWPPPAAMPDGKWWKESLRISEEFVRDIGALIQPGDSAIFMLLRTPKVVSVLRQLRNYGGTLLRTSLSPEQENKVNAVFSCMGTEVRA